MFFILSKIFWYFAMPLNLIGLMVIVGLVLRKFGIATLGKRLLLTSAILFLSIGTLPIGYNLLVFLEKQYERPAPMPESVDGIIVLGGAFNSKIGEKTGMVSANGQIARLIDFIDLSYKYPKAKLVFTGGSGLLLPSGRTEADDVENFLKTMEFDVSKVEFEGKSRNSYENIVFSKQMVAPESDEIWLLITSQYHLPRVTGITKAQEWAVIPYPSSPLTEGEYRLFPTSFNILANFHYTNMAIKEFVGSLVYGLTGKSAFLLPYGHTDS